MGWSEEVNAFRSQEARQRKEKIGNQTLITPPKSKSSANTGVIPLIIVSTALSAAWWMRKEGIKFQDPLQGVVGWLGRVLQGRGKTTGASSAGKRASKTAKKEQAWKRSDPRNMAVQAAIARTQTNAADSNMQPSNQQFSATANRKKKKNKKKKRSH